MFCRRKVTLAVFSHSVRNFCPKILQNDIKSVRKSNVRALLRVPGREEAGALFYVPRRGESAISRYAKRSAPLLSNPAYFGCTGRVNCGHTESSAWNVFLLNQMRKSCTISPHETSLGGLIFPAIFPYYSSAYGIQSFQYWRISFV